MLRLRGDISRAILAFTQGSGPGGFFGQGLAGHARTATSGRRCSKKKKLRYYSWEIKDFRSISGNFLLGYSSVREWPGWDDFFSKMPVSVPTERIVPSTFPFVSLEGSLQLHCLPRSRVRFRFASGEAKCVSELSDYFKLNEKRGYHE